jgi:broad specificity phosphatase PhoE
MKKLREKYKGKRILVVAHGGTARAIGNISLGYTYEEALIHFLPLKNGEAMHINNTPILQST